MSEFSVAPNFKRSYKTPPHYLIQRGDQYVTSSVGYTTTRQHCARNWCDRREVEEYASVLNASGVLPEWQVVPLTAIDAPRVSG